MAIKFTTSVVKLDQVPHLPDEAGVRLPIARALLGCSPASAWRMAKTGKIKAIKISPRITVFNLGSIRAVLRGGC